MRSRFVVGTLALAPDAPEADWIETLVAMRPRLGRALLLPIDDSAAVLVGDHQTRLAEHFLLPDAPLGIHRLLASKVQLDRIAGELGIPTPASTVPADRHELLEQAEQRGYPVVLKRAEPWLASLHPGASSVVIAHDPAQLRAGFDQIQSDPSSPMLLQEYIPGGPESVWMFNGYFGASGACLSHFTGRKLRQRGPGTGPTTLGACVANPEVSELAQRLLSEVGYRGIVDMDFCFDARDGRYKLLDVNPRLGSTFRLFAADNGLDMVRAMHLDLTGRAVPTSAISNGRRWIDERSDLVTALRLASEGSLRLAPWLRSMRSVDETAWWAADDPVPFMVMGADLLPRAVRRLAALRRQRAEAPIAAPDEPELGGLAR